MPVDGDSFEFAVLKTGTFAIAWGGGRGPTGLSAFKHAGNGADWTPAVGLPRDIVSVARFHRGQQLPR